MNIALKRALGDFTVNIAFTASATGITALFGPSGSGKTSVINMVAGLLKPDSGHISIHNRVLFDSEKRINLRPEARRIGYVFQEGRLFPHLSVLSNLTYGRNLLPEHERKIPLAEVTDILGITHLLDRRPRLLSGGEKQRVAIGRALLTSPLLLLMDEPLASLDTARKDELLPYITTINRLYSIPVLYVSHSIEEIHRLTQTIIPIHCGSVKGEG